MTTTVNSAADTGLPGISRSNDLVPPTALDLRDDFDRIANLIRVIHMTVLSPKTPDDHALAEVCWTLEDRCSAFADDLKMLADNERVAS
jgi:hypothetical protein